LDWGALLGVTLDKKTTKKISSLKKDQGYRDWTKAVKECERTVVHLESERRELKLDELEAKLKGYSGGLVAKVLADLQEARLSGATTEQLAAMFDRVQDRPARWLAQSYFGW